MVNLLSKYVELRRLGVRVKQVWTNDLARGSELTLVSLTFFHRSFYVLFYVLIAITYINAKNSIFPNSHLEKLTSLPRLPTSNQAIR